MGLTASGADRILRAATGRFNNQPSEITCRLHTSTSPSGGNELSGNGYSRVSLTRNSFTRDSSSGYRRMNFPAMEWFANAPAAAPNVRSVSLWHGGIIMWFESYSFDPSGRVYANAGDIKVELLAASTDFVVAPTSTDGGLWALGGGSSAANSMFFELHSGIPTSANRLTGGGIDGIATSTWTHANYNAVGMAGTTSAHTWRRAYQRNLLTFSTGLSADTNREPTYLGLWRNRPESTNPKGTLHAYWRLRNLNTTMIGSKITIPANTLYIEVNMSGTRV